jgi:hypothetical protein
MTVALDSPRRGVARDLGQALKLIDQFGGGMTQP